MVGEYAIVVTGAGSKKVLSRGVEVYIGQQSVLGSTWIQGHSYHGRYELRTCGREFGRMLTNPRQRFDGCSKARWKLVAGNQLH